MANILRIEKEFGAQVDTLKFSKPVFCVYNPLTYAWKAHQKFIKAYGRGKRSILFLGMNPGPYGMAQTGVPFGEVSIVRERLGIQAPIGRPRVEHPKRPILGFDCPRSEVSGQRLWSFFLDEHGGACGFFKKHYLINYCPLIFMEESGKNITPDKLAIKERKRLYEICNEHLRNVIAYYQPAHLVGIGKFAQQRALEAGLPENIQVSSILHPSPASPIANRGWGRQAKKQLKELGLA